MKELFLKWMKSSNDYFQQDSVTLKGKWGDFNTYLTLKGYDRDEINVYRKAYSYFILNPNDFDGATKTEDLHDLYNLDLDAMLHDYFYIKYNISASYKYIMKADNLFYNETIRKGKSSWNAGARRFLLGLKTAFGFVLIAKYILGRKMTYENKIDFMNDYYILTRRDRF